MTKTSKNTTSLQMPVIHLCTSARESNVASLVTRLRSTAAHDSVRFVQLPYNDLDSYQWESEARDSKLILCHSIDNRRFAVTNVPDAIYDKFLPHVRSVMGKKNVAVVVHDWPWPLAQPHSTQSSCEDMKKALMQSFEIRQPTTFKCADCVIICGRLDTTVEMDEECWQRMESFLACEPPSSASPATYPQQQVTWYRRYLSEVSDQSKYKNYYTWPASVSLVYLSDLYVLYKVLGTTSMSSWLVGVVGLSSVHLLALFPRFHFMVGTLVHWSFSSPKSSFWVFIVRLLAICQMKQDKESVLSPQRILTFSTVTWLAISPIFNARFESSRYSRFTRPIKFLLVSTATMIVISKLWR